MTKKYFFPVEKKFFTLDLLRSLLLSLLILLIVIKTQFGSFVNLSVPMTLQGDEVFGLRIFANLARFNSFSGSDVGWPDGQNLWDYPPVGDFWNLSLAWIFARLFSNTFLAYNLFYLFTFLLQSLSAYYCIKKMTKSSTVSSFAAMIFPLLPYHFDQGSGHIMLSNYFIVIIGLCYILNTEKSFQNTESSKSLGISKSILMGILCSGFGIYYALFFALTAIAMLLYRICYRRVVVPLMGFLIGQATALVGQMVVVKINQSGAFTAPTRQPWESDLYSLKPFQLILPSPWGAWSPFRNVFGKSREVLSFFGEGTSSLGVGLSSSVLIMCFIVVAEPRARSRHENCSPRTSLRETQIPLLFLMVVYILAAASGGGNSLVSLLGIHEFRVWSRIGIFIATAALIAGSFQLERVWLLLRSRSAFSKAVVITTSLIITLELMPISVHQDQRIAADEIIEEIDGALEKLDSLGFSGAMLQLPIVPFPEEPPVERMTDYSHFIPSLYTANISWSYGAVKYSQPSPLCTGTENLVECAVGNGYSGVWVDRYGYADNGTSIIQELLHLTSELQIDGSLLESRHRYAVVLFGTPEQRK